MDHLEGIFLVLCYGIIIAFVYGIVDALLIIRNRATEAQVMKIRVKFLLI